MFCCCMGCVFGDVLIVFLAGVEDGICRFKWFCFDVISFSEDRSLSKSFALSLDENISETIIRYMSTKTIVIY